MSGMLGPRCLRVIDRSCRRAGGLCSRQFSTPISDPRSAAELLGSDVKATPLLFTPGPLTTSAAVKAAMQRDVGSRDPAFLAVVDSVRRSLVRLAEASPDEYTSVILQGSGTFAVESVIGSVVPREHGGLLIAANGAYGERMERIARTLGIQHSTLRFGEREAVNPGRVVEALRAQPSLTHLAFVHHETTAGVLNPAHAIGRAVAQHAPHVEVILDSMSAFGAYPLAMPAAGIHYMVSSANKCIEGVPGFSFAVAATERLRTTAGRARSLSLDLHEQWAGLERTSQFRFTPPTQALLAFHTALREHEEEGGCAGRLARYQANFAVLKADMAELGFHLYVPEGPAQGCIISTFLWPDDPAFNFDVFYRELAKRGCVIYPGKLTKDNCFRIGSIGRLYPRDMRLLTTAIREVLQGMGVALPVRQIEAAA